MREACCQGNTEEEKTEDARHFSICRLLFNWYQIQLLYSGLHQLMSCWVAESFLLCFALSLSNNGVGNAAVAVDTARIFSGGSEAARFVTSVMSLGTCH